MKNIFTEHPHSIGESYFEHMKFAAIFGFNLIIGGVACTIHAIFPFLFKKTASDVLLKAMHNFVERMPVAEERMVVLSESLEKKLREVS